MWQTNGETSNKGKLNKTHIMFFKNKGNMSFFISYFSFILFVCFFFILFLFVFFFNSVLRPFQGYFSSYETGQSVGGAKTGEPREKPPDTPASRTWLVSHVARAGLEPTPVTAVR